MEQAGSSACPESQEPEEPGEHFLYFAYGSNLLKERLQLRNPSAEFCCVARLQDFRLDFGNYQGETSTSWHGGIATIVSSPGDGVWGVVWKMHARNRSSLDKQEGVSSGTYVPIQVDVRSLEGDVLTCRSYQMRDYVPAPPSPQYKTVICKGARQNGLPPDYQRKLEDIETNDYKGPVTVLQEIEAVIHEKL
ncbi:gamma-glutamylcyclotransferase [Gracilinanus agilis]|uniref:gamma-glutamylcyclotransferase n=1 Tax=Gracilinanus agilis TaxID=191870 RepID=UPI001CFC5599|nr:gamma-glutamylcyclotransferase [Gracilinanus agilis]